MNSVIPILKLVLEMLLNNRNSFNIARMQELVQIAHNSSIHLQNVVNDALDVARIENNKFEINRSRFNIREALKDVYDLMKF